MSLLTVTCTQLKRPFLEIHLESKIRTKKKKEKKNTVTKILMFLIKKFLVIFIKKYTHTYIIYQYSPLQKQIKVMLKVYIHNKLNCLLNHIFARKILVIFNRSPKLYSNDKY